VAIAALAATFWLLVATARLMLNPPAPHVAAAQPPAPGVTAMPARPCHIWKAYPEDYQDNDIEGRPAPKEHPMSRSALVAGFNAVRPKVSACYTKYGVPGTAMVNVVIAKSGRVSKADVTGRFAGTPTGACVEAAVKTAPFPPSDGFSTPFPYQLR